jgi:hypothetical protein
MGLCVYVVGEALVEVAVAEPVGELACESCNALVL